VTRKEVFHVSFWGTVAGVLLGYLITLERRDRS
jgi:hypothetical protein